MQKKFICTSLIISIICMLSTYAAEKQVSGEVRCENFTTSLPDGKARVQISPGGQLIIGDKEESALLLKTH